MLCIDLEASFYLSFPNEEPSTGHGAAGGCLWQASNELILIRQNQSPMAGEGLAGCPASCVNNDSETRKDDIITQGTDKYVHARGGVIV